MSKILVVEDGLYLKDLYKKVLEEEHSVVDAVGDGLDAFNLIRNGGYDLILLDIKLPRMNGIAIVKTLLDNPPLQKNGPIVFFTCDDTDATREKAKELGISYYLIKSNYTPNQLVSEVKKILLVSSQTP